MVGFKVAAGTLDASTKIYAYRVDNVYGDTLKIASGLGQAGKQDEGTGGEGIEGTEEGPGGEDGDPNNPDQPKKKRRLKKSSTVEKNLKNINVSKFELEFDVEDMAEVVTVEDVEKEAMVEGGMGMTVMVMTLAVEEVATVSAGRFL